MLFGFEEQPRDCPWRWSIGALQHSANDIAAVKTLPGWTSEVVANDLASPVEELSLRSLEGPDERACVVGVGFTGVDLDTLRSQLEDEDRTGWRGEVCWYGLRAGGRFLGVRRSGTSQHHQSGDEDQ